MSAEYIAGRVDGRTERPIAKVKPQLLKGNTLAVPPGSALSNLKEMGTPLADDANNQTDRFVETVPMAAMMSRVAGTLAGPHESIVIDKDFAAEVAIKGDKIETGIRPRQLSTLREVFNADTPEPTLPEIRTGFTIEQHFELHKELAIADYNKLRALASNSNGLEELDGLITFLGTRKAEKKHIQSVLQATNLIDNQLASFVTNSFQGVTDKANISEAMERLSTLLSHLKWLKRAAQTPGYIDEERDKKLEQVGDAFWTALKQKIESPALQKHGVSEQGLATRDMKQLADGSWQMRFQILAYIDGQLQPTDITAVGTFDQDTFTIRSATTQAYTPAALLLVATLNGKLAEASQDSKAKTSGGKVTEKSFFEKFRERATNLRKRLASNEKTSVAAASTIKRRLPGGRWGQALAGALALFGLSGTPSSQENITPDTTVSASDNAKPENTVRASVERPARSLVGSYTVDTAQHANTQFAVQKILRQHTEVLNGANPNTIADYWTSLRPGSPLQMARADSSTGNLSHTHVGDNFDLYQQANGSFDLEQRDSRGHYRTIHFASLDDGKIEANLASQRVSTSRSANNTSPAGTANVSVGVDAVGTVDSGSSGMINNPNSIGYYPTHWARQTGATDSQAAQVSQKASEQKPAKQTVSQADLDRLSQADEHTPLPDASIEVAPTTVRAPTAAEIALAELARIDQERAQAQEELERYYREQEALAQRRSRSALSQHLATLVAKTQTLPKYRA